jgi:hypothetical protein
VSFSQPRNPLWCILSQINPRLGNAGYGPNCDYGRLALWQRTIGALMEWSILMLSMVASVKWAIWVSCLYDFMILLSLCPNEIFHNQHVPSVLFTCSLPGEHLLTPSMSNIQHLRDWAHTCLSQGGTYLLSVWDASSMTMSNIQCSRITRQYPYPAQLYGIIYYTSTCHRVTSSRLPGIPYYLVLAYHCRTPWRTIATSIFNIIIFRVIPLYSLLQQVHEPPTCAD